MAGQPRRDTETGTLTWVLTLDGHRLADRALIEVTRDGPYRVRGGIPLTGGHGEDEPRNAGASREHYALCRCGHSQNKPFCSGMHWYVQFRDPVGNNHPDHGGRHQRMMQARQPARLDTRRPVRAGEPEPEDGAAEQGRLHPHCHGGL